MAHFAVLLQDRIVELNVAPPQETAAFTSIIGIASTVSRLVFGYIADHSFVNRLWLYIISVTLCGLVIMSSSLATNYHLMATFCALFGITCGNISPQMFALCKWLINFYFIGTYVSLTSVVLVDLLGLEKLTNAFGLIRLFQGLASLIGPPFFGNFCKTKVYLSII